MDGNYAGESTQLSSWDTYLITTLLGQDASNINPVEAIPAYQATSATAGWHVITVNEGDQLLSLDFGARFSGQNPTNPHDVSDDGATTPFDILLLINLINEFGTLDVNEDTEKQRIFMTSMTTAC